MNLSSSSQDSIVDDNANSRIPPQFGRILDEYCYGGIPSPLFGGCYSTSWVAQLSCESSWSGQGPRLPARAVLDHPSWIQGPVWIQSSGLMNGIAWTMIAGLLLFQVLAPTQLSACFGVKRS